MSNRESTLRFDNFDVDLLVKVFDNIVLSPIFAVLVPFMYKTQGLPWNSSIVVSTSIYFLVVAAIWLMRYASKAWRNRGVSGRMDWGEQIVVITGGSSGIGALLANTLAVRHVTTIVLDVNPIITENYNITYYKCDVSKWEEVEKVSKQIVEEIGHPTVIVNNAGVVQGKLLLDLTEEDVKQTMDTNVLAHFWTLKAFLPEMIKKNAGHIVTVSSVLGVIGAAQLSDYCASKGALNLLHDSLRYELDKRYNAPRIRTTLALPGHVWTPLFSGASSFRNTPAAAPFRGLLNFLAPSLAPHMLVKAIIAALDLQESREIALPFYSNLVRFVPLLPSWARDFCQWFSGADYTMEGFVKVTGRRADEPAVQAQSEVPEKS